MKKLIIWVVACLYWAVMKVGKATGIAYRYDVWAFKRKYLIRKEPINIDGGAFFEWEQMNASHQQYARMKVLIDQVLSMYPHLKEEYEATKAEFIADLANHSRPLRNDYIVTADNFDIFPWDREGVGPGLTIEEYEEKFLSNK